MVGKLSVGQCRQLHDRMKSILNSGSRESTSFLMRQARLSPLTFHRSFRFLLRRGWGGGLADCPSWPEATKCLSCLSPLRHNSSISNLVHTIAL